MTDTNFDKVLAALDDSDSRITAETIYSLNDLSRTQRKRLAEAWPALPAAQRRQLVRRLVETGETNFEMNFDAVYSVALEDADETVRVAAIEGMWENESADYMHRLLTLVTEDPMAEVRAAAASDLGRFILLGELGDFPEDQAKKAQDTIANVLAQPDEHPGVRRRALESIANCGHVGVTGWIEDAYAEPSAEWQASALFAMGRSCDRRWGPTVIQELQSDNPAIVYEAARAAGELELREAVSDLADLLYHQDRQVQEIAVWALGEIGGETATRLLENMFDRAPDEAFTESIEEALGMANLIGDGMPFDMFEFDPPE